MSIVLNLAIFTAFQRTNIVIALLGFYHRPVGRDAWSGRNPRLYFWSLSSAGRASRRT